MVSQAGLPPPSPVVRSNHNTPVMRATHTPVMRTNTASSPMPKMIELQNMETTFREKEKEYKMERMPKRTMWHVHNRWGLFAWIEFGLKIIACITAFISLTTITTSLKVSLLRVVEIALFAPLILGFLLPLLSAFSQREAFNFFYVIVTFFGHIAVIFVLLYGSTGINIIVFCTLMTVGEFFRLVFLEATPKSKLPPGFTAARRRFLIGFVFTYVIIYLVVTAMETMTVIDENRAYVNYNIVSL